MFTNCIKLTKTKQTCLLVSFLNHFKHSQFKLCQQKVTNGAYVAGLKSTNLSVDANIGFILRFYNLLIINRLILRCRIIG